MRDLLPTLAAIGLALAIVAGSIAAGDRQLFVPPPEAVAENFVRELVMGRYDLAAKYLRSDLRRSIGARGLRERFAPMRSTLGAINGVDAEPEFMSSDHAAAHASVDAQHGHASISLRFTREYGLWVVSEIQN